MSQYYKPSHNNFVSIYLEKHSIMAHEIYIHDDEYDVCANAGKSWWLQSKGQSIYNDGILNTDQDKFKTERIGMLGEFSFAKLFNLEVNVGYEHKGCDHDFIIGDTTIDVKCASRDYGKGLIVAQNQWGKKRPLKCSHYVVCYLHKEIPENKWASVIVVGYQTDDVIKKLKPIRSCVPGATHLNYELEFDKLKPITLDMEW